MSNVILFRNELKLEEEVKAARQHFSVITQRALIKKDDFVIPRYSFLPYAREFEEDVNILGGRLINSYKEHQFAADIGNWYEVLEEYTFKTWFNTMEIPLTENGPFVVKGRTNSKKHDWNTKMYVKDRSKLGYVIARLLDDPLIAMQDICVRKYTPLQTFMNGENELPITNEWRSFWYKGTFIAMAYYWQSHFFDLPIEMSRTLQKDSEYYDKVFEFVQPIAQSIKNEIPFVCIDAAFKKEGEIVLVEINDACMSGLSCIDSDTFYRRLKNVVSNGIM